MDEILLGKPRHTWNDNVRLGRTESSKDTWKRKQDKECSLPISSIWQNKQTRGKGRGREQVWVCLRCQLSITLFVQEVKWMVCSLGSVCFLSPEQS